MVYGIVLISSLLAGAFYWITAYTGDDKTHSYMWSPGSGHIEHEPWIFEGGYSGWSPGRDAYYSPWGPGRYLNPLNAMAATTAAPTTTRRTRIPPKFPGSLTEYLSPPSYSTPDEDEVTPDSPPSVKSTPEQEPEKLAPDTESDNRRRGNFLQPLGPVTEHLPTTLPPDGVYHYPAPEWRSKDQYEEAYEDYPHNLANSRPPGKLPVQGWGYD